MNALTDDMWRLAALLVERYGQGALSEAAERAQAALAEENIVDHGVWLKVGEAVREVLRAASDNDAFN
jgi:hypothetical protein